MCGARGGECGWTWGWQNRCLAVSSAYLITLKGVPRYDLYLSWFINCVPLGSVICFSFDIFAEKSFCRSF